MASITHCSTLPSITALYADAQLSPPLTNGVSSSKNRTTTTSHSSDSDSEPHATVFRPSAAINSRVALYRGDITRLGADAIVNAANSSLQGGGGVDGAIHRAAGPQLLEECMALDNRPCPAGSARITGAGELAPQVRHVIHAVGPIYRRYARHEAACVLRGCYQTALRLADEAGCRSVAFSAISTGVYGFPSREAAEVAARTVREYLERRAEGDGVQRVVFVTFEDKDGKAYREVLPIYFPPVPTSSTSTTTHTEHSAKEEEEKSDG